MKKILSTLAVLFCSISFLQISIFAQEKQTDEWIRVSSDNAEFSMEVPAKYDYFYDENGFWVSKDSKDYELQKMNMLNAYHENTLLSLESYKAKKGAVEAVYESDGRFPEKLIKSSFKRNGVTIKQIIVKNADYYYLRQYFHSKSSIYILTVASKKGENATMKRFLDSLIFNPDTNEKSQVNSILFSSLKATPVNLTTAKKSADEDKKDETDKTANNLNKDNASKLIIVKKTPPSYVDSARMKSIQGKIQLRTTFSENGFISAIEILKSLPEGLLRQAVFAALRIKFLPREDAEKTVSTTKTIEYNFAIY